MITVSLMGVHLPIWATNKNIKQTKDLCWKIPNGGAMLSFRLRSLALEALCLPWCGAPGPLQCPGPRCTPRWEWEWKMESWTSALEKRHDTLVTQIHMIHILCCIYVLKKMFFIHWYPLIIFFRSFSSPAKKKTRVWKIHLWHCLRGFPWSWPVWKAARAGSPIVWDLDSRHRSMVCHGKAEDNETSSFGRYLSCSWGRVDP